MYNERAPGEARKAKLSSRDAPSADTVTSPDKSVKRSGHKEARSSGVSDTFRVQHNTPPPRGGLWRRPVFRLRSSSQVRDGCQVSATLGQSLGLAVWRWVLQLAKRQTVSPGCQHLLQRLYHLPAVRGEHLSHLRPAAEPQTWTRSVPQRQGRGSGHSQSRRIVTSTDGIDRQCREGGAVAPDDFSRPFLTRRDPPALCRSANSATCCMTNVLLSGVVLRSPGTCTGLNLAKRMLKVKSRHGEQSVLLNPEQRDAGPSRPQNRNFAKKT
ncbi:hypothetical protein EYF80_002376 [Liparis tanakae]|uniref:Uncharacterized protein n=1 Tax=Liparis tanakae TaxID=230148 RepID=A0A4Z2JBF9_9TELE|nr:hypothetical protein EYF80_002376 [Liparis tanakae]